MSNRINLLWFDDDLRPRSDGDSSERERLQTWLRYLHTTDRVERICLIEVRDLASFRQQLELRCNKPVHDPEHIDAFLIDVLWRECQDPMKWTFGELDPVFSDERVLPLDAGAQLIGLMRNRRHEARRPPWLKAFDQHPIAVLTTLTDHRGTVDRHIEDEVLKRVKILVKNSSQDADEPDEAFCRWVDGLARRSAANSPAVNGPP
jgi:hypothetical protein